MIGQVRILTTALLCFALAGVLTGCQALRELASVQSIAFALDRVEGGELAGVDMRRFRSYADLSVSDAGHIAAAVASGELPLRFDLIIAARNPADNPVPARLTRFEWTLLVDGTETVNGIFDDQVTIQPGDVEQFPLSIEIDLVRFFARSARDLVDLALAVLGRGEAQELTVRAVPSVDTPLGRIAYPEPIVIVHREFGRTRSEAGP